MTGVGVGSDQSRAWVESKGAPKGHWSIRSDRKATIDLRAVCSHSSNGSLILARLVPYGTFLYINSSFIKLHHKISTVSNIQGEVEAVDQIGLAM